MLKYLVIRVLLWFIGLFVSLFPTLFAVGTKCLTWPPFKVAIIINEAGQFRDVLFVIVVISVLEISLVVDSLWVNRKKMGDELFWSARILLILNIVVLGSSLTGFVVLPPQGLVPVAWIPSVIWLVVVGAGIGLLTEIVISVGNDYLK